MCPSWTLHCKLTFAKHGHSALLKTFSIGEALGSCAGRNQFPGTAGLGNVGSVCHDAIKQTGVPP